MQLRPTQLRSKALALLEYAFRPSAYLIVGQLTAHHTYNAVISKAFSCDRASEYAIASRIF
ncbi:hypothetical protein IQ256_08285 [cf. Phormidesmis sp. LEGE 11477]|nr:hypothetical protein [cf. Phormidesmis sp. LEGE 11477]